MLPPYSSIVDSLPASTPFVGPEALVRQSGCTIELRLGANESPFGPSPLALARMREAIEEAHLYGDPECHILREELSARLGVRMDCILVGAGIDELLSLCCHLFIDPGAYAVTTLGSYPTFDFVATGCGGLIERVPYHNESPNLVWLSDSARRVRARILYLANPDNPSGSWHRPQGIAQLRDSLVPECVLLLDEAYYEFAPESPAIDPSDSQVIRLRTFSKVHGMAGMRIGYLVAHPEHIKALDKIRLHFGVNRVAQAGAVASLLDSSHSDLVTSETAKGRSELIEYFASIGFRSIDSHTNFLTVDVGSKERAEAILTKLLEQGVFIRKPGLPPLDQCIRVTVGRPEQRVRLYEVFEGIIRTV